MDGYERRLFSVKTAGSATIKRGLRNIHLTNERERKRRWKGVMEAFIINGHFAHPVTGEMNARSMESQIAVMTSEPCLLTLASSAPSLLHVSQIRDGAGIGKVAPGEKVKELTTIRNAVKIATLRTRKYMAISGRDPYENDFYAR